MTSLVKNLAGSLWTTLAVVVVVSALAVAVVVGVFTLLFAVLPFGIRSQAESGEVVAGSEPGAPSAPALREKAIWTTLLAAIVLVAVAALFPLAGL